MTNKKEAAQTIWNTYIGAYSKVLMTPVEQFDTYMDDDIKKILSCVLREVINQLQQSSFTHPAYISCLDLLELCEELENL